MTAVIGILNKDAIAIAADSAVTISGPNGTKILNGANKIFRLSKFHPVGIMLYNSASFMGTPWETIIKLFRKELLNLEYETINSYVAAFLDFLRRYDFFTNEETSKSYVSFNMGDFFLKFIPVQIQDEMLDQDMTEERKAELMKLIYESLVKYKKRIEDAAIVPEFTSLSIEEYQAKYLPLQNEFLDINFSRLGFPVSAEFQKLITESLYEYIRREICDTSFTGLIFCGFGKVELYPVLIPVNIAFSFGGRLHYYVQANKCAEIKSVNQGVIAPFAQKDVMDTILSGIDPGLEKIFDRNLLRFFDKYNKEILALVGSENSDLRAKIENMDKKKIILEYLQNNRVIKQKKYIQPLVDAVGTLSKPDLAEMAESLIYLTYLKRRITFAEESVGGPVDVAVISKGDGFIWIKRKQYFDPKLNQHFFDNYYNF